MIFQNSDVALEPNAIREMRRHAALFGAFSMRRKEPGQSYVHIGREVFGFRSDWLESHIDQIPEFYMGAPYFDLVMAALIRKERGVVSTVENMATDFYPCEMEAGPAIHEPHASSWAGDQEYTLPANQVNRLEAAKWCAANCPSLTV